MSSWLGPGPEEPAPAEQGGEAGLALAGDADPAGILAHLHLLLFWDTSFCSLRRNKGVNSSLCCGEAEDLRGMLLPS